MKTVLATTALAATVASVAATPPQPVVVPFFTQSGTVTLGGGGTLTVAVDATGATFTGTATGAAANAPLAVKVAFDCGEVEGASDFGTPATVADAAAVNAVVAAPAGLTSDMRYFAGKAVMVGTDCGIITPDGEGTDFYPIKIGSYGEWREPDANQKAEVVLFDQPTGVANENALGDNALGTASMKFDADATTISFSFVSDVPASTNIKAAFVNQPSCAAAAGNGAGTIPAGYGAIDPTNGYNAEDLGVFTSSQDGDGEAVLTLNVPLTPAQVKDKVLVVYGPTGAAGALTEQYIMCGHVVSTPAVRGYAGIAVDQQGEVWVSGHVAGLQAIEGLIGSWHLHTAKDDVDSGSYTYPDCSVEDSIGEHLKGDDDTDYWASLVESTIRYEVNLVGGVGAAALGCTIPASAGFSMEDLKYQALVVHTEVVDNDLHHELRIGCGNILSQPPQVETTPGVVIEGAAGANTVSVVALSAAAFAALRMLA